MTLSSACGSDDPLPPVIRHAVVVTVATSGSSPDVDGYTVTLGSDQREISVSGSVTFEDLAPGSYDVSLGGVAPNCAVAGGELRAVTVTAGQSATVSFEVACVFDAAGIALPETACPALSPSTLEGMPLAVVWIGSLPPNLDPDPIARVSWAGGPEVTFGFVDDQVDPATVMIPIHPSGAIEGGDVTIRIADDVQSCPPFTFRILPMPPAPGELGATFTLAEELIGVQALLFGTTVDDLLNLQVTEDDQALLPLAFAQTLVSDPANAYSLGAFANGSAPEFEPEDADMLDRLVARIGIRADMEAALSSIMSDDPVSPSPARAPLGLTQGLALSCVISIDSAQLLHECMTLARDKAQGPASKATQDKAIFAMEVAAMIPGPPRRFARPIAALITYSKLYDQAVADNLPSEFVDITVSYDPLEFEEDQEGPGTWTPAHVRATSNGWNTEETLSELLGGFVNPRPIHRWTQKVRQINWSANQLLQGLFDYADAYIADLLGHLLEPLIKQGLNLGDDLLVLPPRTFGPVDVSDAEWTHSRIVEGSSVVLTSHEAYDPREPGTSLLEVITAQGKFGGANIAPPRQPIDVSQLEVSIDPKEVIVSDESEVWFTVTVANSAHPASIEIDPAVALQGTAEMSLGTGDTHTVVYTVPQSPNPDDVDVLTVRHTAQSGARGHSTANRFDFATIRFGDIHLEPVTQCVEPGGPPVQLQVLVTGLGNPDLVWTWSAGSVSDAGLFTPPSEAGEVQITVAVADKPEISDTISVTVGACVCQFTVQVSTDPVYVAQPGDTAEYHSYGNPPDVLAVYLRGQSGYALFAVDPSQTRPTGPGTYELTEIGGQLGYSGGPYATYGDDGGTLDISEFEPHTTLVGTASGTMRDSNDPTNIFLTFAATFSIYPPPQSAFGVYRCVVPAAGG
jgi:hypothetical protein